MPNWLAHPFFPHTHEISLISHSLLGTCEMFIEICLNRKIISQQSETYNNAKPMNLDEQRTRERRIKLKFHEHFFDICKISRKFFNLIFDIPSTVLPLRPSFGILRQVMMIEEASMTVKFVLNLSILSWKSCFDNDTFHSIVVCANEELTAVCGVFVQCKGSSCLLSVNWITNSKRMNMNCCLL